jgi:ABC-type transport system substrate-binding protein
LADFGREAEREVNDARRAALYLKLNRMIAQIGPWVPMFQPVVPYAFQSNVRGVTFASSWEVDSCAVSKG